MIVQRIKTFFYHFTFFFTTMTTFNKIIAVVSVLCALSFVSTNSFAQKHSKKHSDNYFSAPSHTYSNSSYYSGNSDWKIGGDFGMMFSFLKASSGVSPFANVLADYSTSHNFGIEAKLNLTRASNSGAYGDLGSSVKTTVGVAQTTIGLGISVRYDFSKNVFMTAGPRLYLPVGSMTLSVDQNDGGHTQHGETTLDGVSSTAFGIEIGAGYRFNLTNSMQIVPRVSYQFLSGSGTETSIGNGLSISPSTASCFQISVGIMSSL